MPAEVDRLIKEFRDAIAGREQSAKDQIVMAWLKVENGLDADMAALSAEIVRRQAAGEVVTQQILWRMETYRRTYAEMDNLYDAYRAEAGALIGRAQTDAYLLGVDKANNLLEAQIRTSGLFPKYWERLNVNAVEAAVGLMNDKHPWYAKLQDSFGFMAEDFRNALTDGIARGQGVAQLAESMRDAITIGADRALLIAQTEMSRAYRSGSVHQFRESEVVDGYLRLVKKETACLACLVLDGEMYELSEDMQDHPRGFCDVIAIIPGVDMPKWERGTTWLRNQPEEKQRAVMGNTRFELWKSGEVKLDAFATKKVSKIWGAQPAIVNVSDLPGDRAS